MTIREIKDISKSKLKGRYFEAVAVVTACLLVYAFLFAIGAALTYAVYNGAVNSAAHIEGGGKNFFGDNPFVTGNVIGIVFKVSFFLLTLAGITPVLCGAARWFSKTSEVSVASVKPSKLSFSSENDNDVFRDITMPNKKSKKAKRNKSVKSETSEHESFTYPMPGINENIDFLKTVSDFAMVRRAFALIFITVLIISFLTIPVVFFSWCSYTVFIAANGSAQTEIFFLISINAAVAAIFLIFNIIKFGFSLAALPVLFTQSPSANPFSLIRKSSKVMRGHRLNFLRLLLSYFYFLPIALTIVALPFVLPQILTSAAVFLNFISVDTN